MDESIIKKKRHLYWKKNAICKMQSYI